MPALILLLTAVFVLVVVAVTISPHLYVLCHHYLSPSNFGVLRP